MSANDRPTRSAAPDRSTFRGDRRLICVTGALLLGFVLIPALAGALAVQENLTEMVNGADEIVLGSVLNVSCRWTEDHRTIVTDVEVAVTDPLKGSPGESVTLTVEGGTVDGRTLWVEDQPVFSKGDIGVFLVDDRQSGRTIHGSDRGFFPVSRETLSALGETRLSPEEFIRSLSDQEPVAPATVGAAATPVITGVSPDSAPANGVSLVTITGSGFGTKPERMSPADVYFLARYEGEQEGLHVVKEIQASGGPVYGLTTNNIVSWSDSRIQVKVPSNQVIQGGEYGNPSSGYIQVGNDQGEFSAKIPFSVPFAYLNHKWNTPVRYVINNNCPDLSDAVTPIENAMNSWNAAVPGAKFHLSNIGPSSSSVTAEDGVNLIYFDELDDTKTIAVNKQWFLDGVISESDIAFNTYFTFSTEPGEEQTLDLGTTALHELGHTAGLADLYGGYPGYPDDDDKVMFGRATFDTRLMKAPGHGDLVGIRWIYTPAETYRYADLDFASFSAPATGTIGDWFLMRGEVKNIGKVHTANFRIRYFLSDDQEITNKDKLIGERYLGSLAPGTKTSADAHVTIPPGITAGSYYVGAIADADRAIGEPDEDNNVAFSSLPCTISNPKPNLKFEASDLPADGISGGTVLVEDTVVNAGMSPAGSFTILYSLESNEELGDKIPIGSRIVGGLAPGESDAETTVLSIPSSVAPGERTMWVHVDEGNSVDEADEADNSLKGTIRIYPAGPDLRTIALDGPRTGFAGRQITVNDTVRNQGTVPAGQFGVGYYLVDRGAHANSRFIGNRTVQSLGAGVAEDGSANVTIPSGTPEGTYYLAAVADDGDAIAEPNEANNGITLRSSPIRITRRPDLTIPGFSGPSTGDSGDWITLAGEVRNIGSAKAGRFSVGYFLENGAMQRTKIGERSYVRGLRAGGFDRRHVEVRIPATVPTGTYRLVAVADWRNVVREADEQNNTRFGGNIGVVQRADLVVTSLGGPETAATGGPVEIRDTVKNIGVGNSGPFSVRYLLLNSSGEFVLGERTVADLDSGEEDESTTGLTVPAGIGTGRYTLRAFADAGLTVPELRESNNNATTRQKVTMVTDSGQPGTIGDLHAETCGETAITWTWTDPTDPDFSRVLVWFDGVSRPDVPKGVRHYDATGLVPDTAYTISTRTVDITGNINPTWINDTARTAGPVTVTGIDPAIASVGTTIAGNITGSGFAPGATLEFCLAGYPNLTATVNSVGISRIGYSLVIPDGAHPGTWTATVTNPDHRAGSGGSLDVQWPAPSVTGINPPGGYAGTSVPVTIYGSGFRGACSATLVKSGGGLLNLAGASATDTTISGTVNIPASARGVWSVNVSNPHGPGTTLPDAFTITLAPAPAVTGISPAFHSNCLVSDHTVSGTGFMEGAQVVLVKAGQANVTATVTSVTPASISCTVPVTAIYYPNLENWNVVVTNPDGQEGSTGGFTFSICE